MVNKDVVKDVVYLSSDKTRFILLDAIATDGCKADSKVKAPEECEE
jgi:hypothetical protein